MIRSQEESEKINVVENQQEGEAAEKPKRKSKLPSNNVVLLVLCVLLAAALVVNYRLSVMVTNQSVQTLKEENEALRKDLAEITSSFKKQPTCQPPETQNRTCLKCGAGWEEHGGTCYYFSTYVLSWQESRGCCRDAGGDLVKIDSREEQEFLVGKLRNMTDEWDRFWIGLTDSLTEDIWLWVDGSLLNKSLSYWINGEPNNWKKWYPNGEDCVVLIMEKDIGDLMTWNDHSCNVPARYVCEKSSVPDQSSCV